MTDNVFAPPQAELETRVGPEELWEIPYKQVRKLAMATLNIRALGVLWGLGSMVLIAGLVAVAFTPSQASAPATISAVLLVLIGGLSVAACYSAFSRPAWGRPLGIVFCALALLNFPFGTIIGILGLVAYVQGKRLFGPDKLLHKDVMAVYKVRKKDKK